MKINQIKHNHSLTDLLKVLLFSILMLLPFLDVGTRCAYVIANKNAYQSYSGNNQTETYESYDYNQLEYGKEYDLITANQTTTGTLTIYGDYISYLKTNNTSVDLTNYSSLYISNNNLIFQGNGQTNIYETYDSVVKITFNYVSYSASSTFTGLDDAFKTLVINESSNLDNVFEYSVSQLESSSLYNWTTQTAIYSGVSEMTTQLGITTNIIPMVLCYWFFMTIIYIILDIVIKLFTILTHFIGSKTSS